MAVTHLGLQGMLLHVHRLAALRLAATTRKAQRAREVQALHV